MPLLSAFYGILIKMYHDDHNPPHFHAFYGEFESLIEIKTGKIIKGHFSPRLLRLIDEWRKIHVADLERAWQLTQNMKQPKRIRPLE